MFQSKAEDVYYSFTFALSFARSLMFTTYAVYYVRILGFNPFELVLVETALEATIFMMQSPTGVVADVYSRRRSMVIGVLLLGIGFVTEGLVGWQKSWLLGAGIPLFGAVVLSQMIEGLGYSFLGGAEESWIAGEMGNARIATVLLRAGQFGSWASIAGVCAGVWLASSHLYLPYLTGGCVHLLTAVHFARLAPERNFVPVNTREKGALLKALGTLRDGLALIRNSRLLVTMIIVTCVSGAAHEGFDCLWGAHILSDFSQPGWISISEVMWFGTISICTSLLAIVASGYVRRRLNTESDTAVRLTSSDSQASGSLVSFRLDCFHHSASLREVFSSRRWLGL